MRKIDSGGNYGGREKQALYYEFERVAVQNGLLDEFPDEYSFYFVAASAVLLRSIDRFSEDLVTFTVREESEIVPIIDVWKLSDSYYFESLWYGKLWEYLGYERPFMQDYYFEIPYEGMSSHRMRDVPDWINSSCFHTEFGSQLRYLVNNRDWGCEYSPYDKLTWHMRMCRFLGNTLFLCKEVLKQCPDYSEPIRRVMFAFDKNRNQEAQHVYDAVMRVVPRR